MFKTVSAALVAASLMFAPGLSASAAAAQGVTTTKTVTVVKKGPRHVVRHTRHKHVTFMRGHRKIVVIKKTRNGKIVKVHRHSHVIVAKPRVRAY
jgi:hypothetical protein